MPAARAKKAGAKSYPRRYRIASLVLRSVSPMVSQACGFATVRRVSLNGDFSVAIIHYNVLSGDVEAAQKILDEQAGAFRKRLAEQLNMRSTPKLVFEPDEDGIAADEMREFLEKIDAEMPSDSA